MTKIPAIALRGMTILPGMIAHFDISREKSIKAVEAAMNKNQDLYLVTQRDVEVENPKIEQLFEIGIIADIKQVIKMQNNIVRVLAEGKSRGKILKFSECEEYLEAEIEELEEIEEQLPETAKRAMAKSIRDNFTRYVKMHGKIAPDTIKQANNIQELNKLINYVSNTLPIGYADKQHILEANSPSPCKRRFIW